jgi:flagellar biosynthetic protein FliP
MTPSTVQQLLESDLFGSLSPQLKLALFMGSLAFLSAALVSMTAFTRIVIVLSFIRRALSTQEIPPTQVILALALFLTGFVMWPTFAELEQQAILPFLNDQLTADAAIGRGADTLRRFMLQQTRVTDLKLFVELSATTAPSGPEETPLHVLVPAFIISELKTAFIMGFCIYLPFLLVDLVVSVILMSLGMMMMPPVVVSTPLKLLLFVLMDGWQLLTQALCLSFRT